MIEQKPIPTLAKSAATLAQAGFQITLNQLGAETLLAMGLPSDEGWRVDFSNGAAFREVPESAVPGADQKVALGVQARPKPS